MTLAGALPVLMFHSVAPPEALEPHKWLRSISVPVDLFEATLADWSRRGIHTVDSAELRSHLTGEKRLPRRSVMLTFDDGYLDNWVAVLPLLKRYGHRAVVFMSTDFIDPASRPRESLDGTAEPSRWQGYLSAPELRAMADSGHVEIGSHARTHTWEFTSEKIIDFYNPSWNIEHAKCRYRFLWLNKHRDEKHAALQHLSREAVPWGAPVYEFAPALVARRYIADPHLEQHLVDTVRERGGESFFDRPDWRASLHAEVAAYRERAGDNGRQESLEERRERIGDELSGSRAVLEEITGRPIRFLSPPQGAIDDETYRLARECGYDLVTAPSSRGIRLNRPGAGLGWVHRCGTGYSLFGRDVSRRRAMLSQRIVMARCAGDPAALVTTKMVGTLRAMQSGLGGLLKGSAAGRSM